MLHKHLDTQTHGIMQHNQNLILIFQLSYSTQPNSYDLCHFNHPTPKRPLPLKPSPPHTSKPAGDCHVQTASWMRVWRHESHRAPERLLNIRDLARTWVLFSRNRKKIPFTWQCAKGKMQHLRDRSLQRVLQCDIITPEIKFFFAKLDLSLVGKCCACEYTDIMRLGGLCM